jgi:hypothetical protein
MWLLDVKERREKRSLLRLQTARAHRLWGGDGGVYNGGMIGREG